MKNPSINKIPNIPPGKWQDAVITTAIRKYDFDKLDYCNTTQEEAVKVYGGSGLCINGDPTTGFNVTHIKTGRTITSNRRISELAARRYLLKILRIFPGFDWSRDWEEIENDPAKGAVVHYLLYGTDQSRQIRAGDPRSST